MDLEAGTYYVSVSQYVSSTGTYTLTGTIRYSNAAIPTITEQPVGATYNYNATATALSVTANTVDGGTLTYQWYRNTTNSTTGGISVGTDRTYTPPTTSVGTYYYYVEVTNINNSVTGTKRASVASNAVAVEVTAGTGIANISSAQLSVYPNPVKTELFIKSDLQIQKIEIYALSGALLLSENNFNEKISVSAFPKGVYLLKVYTKKGAAIQKVVKE